MKKTTVLIGAVIVTVVTFFIVNTQKTVEKEKIQTVVEQKKPAPAKVSVTAPLRFEKLHLNPEMK